MAAVEQEFVQAHLMSGVLQTGGGGSEQETPAAWQVRFTSQYVRPGPQLNVVTMLLRLADGPPAESKAVALNVVLTPLFSLSGSWMENP